MHDARWIVVAVIAVAVIAAAIVWALVRRRRTDRLRRQFGPEYREAVRQYGDATRAEAELEEREKRVRGLEIRTLSADEVGRYTAAWRGAQARFVDDPPRATADADRLVQEVLAARGYPVAEFAQRVEDISVDHPGVVAHYRAAHGIALALADGRARTEDLRQAMIHYRALFDDLLEIRAETPRRMEA
jgi:hypothetical protein